MAEALSVAGVMISTTSVVSSFVAAWYSSAYESERTLREFTGQCDELEKLSECLRVLADSTQPSQTSSEALWPGQRACRTLLRGTSSAAVYLTSSIREMTGDHGSIALMRCTKPLEAYCRQQAKYTPIIWRLQSWITKIVVNRLPLLAHESSTIPSIGHPTPNVLLLSWTVLPVATVVYYRSQLGSQHGGYYLVGSVLMACVVGVLESSGVATVILLNIPWCLTIGMLLHIIVQGASRRSRARRIQRNHTSYSLLPIVVRDVEKMAGKEQLS